MKKFVTILLGVAMLISLLSGCRKKILVPETATITTEVSVETAATEETATPAVYTEVTEVTKETVTATTEQVRNDTVFKPGTWMARCGPVSRYYFFEIDGDAGCCVDMKDGSDAVFSYNQTGDQGVFHFAANGAGSACKVVVQDEDHITLEWENQQMETMTYVSVLGMEQFHFYTHEELAEMALEDYRAKNDPADESLVAAGMDNGDGTTTIQIYQNLGDHNSTAAYYWVDRCTGKGQNISNGTDVDLTDGTQDMDIFYENSESILPGNIQKLVLSETEYSEKIVLQPLVTVTDFRVVSLEFVEREEEFGFRLVEQLYEAASIRPEDALIITMEFPEIIPNVGVIYRDRNGEEQFYAVMYSGLDGSALLTEENLF